MFISMSYRNRGSVARIQTQIKQKIKVRTISLDIRWTPSKATVKEEKNIILAYSAMKIKANIPAPNSILNPDTNSDSPSAKSKGVRLVSATHLISHIKYRGPPRMAIAVLEALLTVSSRFKPQETQKNLKKIKARLIS